VQRRIEEWILSLRSELESTSEDETSDEASAVASSYLERDQKLSHEVGRFWGDIADTFEGFGMEEGRRPVFDRMERLA